MTIKIHSIFFDLGNTLVSGRSWVDGAQSLLDNTRGRGLRLGIISDTGDLSRVELLSHLPADFSFDDFDTSLIILSSEVGVEKPDQKIFEHAIDRSGGEAQQSLFVTEDLEHTQVAQAMGMRIARVRPSHGNDLKALLPALETAGLLS
jgi:putative hydrolase of the HAD superfamily